MKKVLLVLVMLIPFTIFAEVDEIDFNKEPVFDSDIILKSGLNQKLVLPDYTEQSGTTWVVEDESIATIDQDGVVTAHSEGKTVVTADTHDGYKTEYTINVYSTVGYYWNKVLDFCKENWIPVVIVVVVLLIFFFIKATF